MPAEVHGILLLDKPLQASSAGAVARVKRLFQAHKAGHTGSLDPLATGLLPICLGEATKFGAPLLEADKTYRVTVRLGERTPSADRESPVVERRALPPFTTEDLSEALREFPRAYAQVPPMHSALKQQGRPLYEYARAGETRERAARDIVIHELHLVEWRSPELTFEVRCSKGAYIRVMAEDLAARLGTIGHLAVLRRVAVTPFGTLASPPDLWTFEALEALPLERRRELLLPVDAALTGCGRLDLPAESLQAFLRGQAVPVPADAGGGSAPRVRVYGAGRGFLGLGSIEPPGRLVPVRLVAAGQIDDRP